MGKIRKVPKYTPLPTGRTPELRRKLAECVEALGEDELRGKATKTGVVAMPIDRLHAELCRGGDAK